MNDRANQPSRLVTHFRDVFQALRDQLGRIVVGHSESIEQILTAFFAGGHVLIEGVPGTGKTLIVRTLGEALNLSFNRVQFTVDLMPADITGTRVVVEEDGRRHFQFVPGPIFTHVLLADEINRATPKTQSALLEAMAELQVTVSGTTYKLQPPLFVVATLNPIEMEGTYPLPEAQLDRFLFKTLLSYPSAEELQRIIGSTTGPTLHVIEPLFEASEAPARLEELRGLVREVMVAPQLENYAAALVHATLPPGSKFSPVRLDAGKVDEHVARYVGFGASPRGGQALLLGAKVRALLDGRVHISYDDIDAVAEPALAHRLVLNFAAVADGIDSRAIIRRLVQSVQRLRK